MSDRRITLTLSESEVNFIKKTCDRRGVTKQELLRDLLGEYRRKIRAIERVKVRTKNGDL